MSSITVHGIPRIVKTESNATKLAWSILVLTSVCFGLYNISSSISDFSQYDVITNVERVSPKNVTFPAITICLKGFYRLTEKLIFKQTPSLFLRDFNFKNKKPGLQLEFFRIPKSFGSCLRFNGFTSPNRTALETAETKADSFRFAALKDRQIDISSNESHEYAVHPEMQVYVADNYLNSFMLSDPLSLDFKEDRRISIVKAETQVKLGEPYNKCVVPSDPTYRQMNCIEQCINMEIRTEYNCSIPSYFRIDGLEECGGELEDYKSTAKNEESEVYEKHMDYIEGLTDEFYAPCESQCAEECQTSLFSTDVYSSKIDSGKYFLFSFSDFSSLQITQIPKMNAFSLISSVGGSLGLFIGISFLSFVEILEFLIELIFLLFSTYQ